MKKYYINPKTGRVIFHGSKTYYLLKNNKIKPTKHKCVYNLNSAQKCIANIFKLYPDVTYPSSSFMKLPRTYDMGPARAFYIKNKKAIAFVDKYGKIHKLRRHILPDVKVIYILDPYNMAEAAITRAPFVTNVAQLKIEKQLQHGQIKTTLNMLYNPIHNDFVPIKQSVDVQDQKTIIDMTQQLVPEKLLPIKDSNISGIVQDDQSNIVGVVDSDNTVQLFNEPYQSSNNNETSPPTIKTNEPQIETQIESETSKEAQPEIDLSTETKTDATESKTSDNTLTETSEDAETQTEPELNTDQTKTESETSEHAETQTKPELNTDQTEKESETSEHAETQTELELNTYQTEKETETNEDAQTHTEPETDLSKIVSKNENVAETSPEVDSDPATVVNSPVDVFPVLKLNDDIISVANILDEKEENKIKQTIQKLCQDDEENYMGQCISCKGYGLEWDSKYKKCRMSLSQPLQLLSTKYGETLGFLVDDKNIL
jgi:hypothetical protein